MKFNSVLAIVFCLLFSSSAFAWKVMLKPKKRISLCDFSVQEGMFKEYVKSGLNLDDMRIINQDADLLKKDFTAYDSYNGYQNNYGVKTYSVNAGFQLNGQDNLFHKFSPKLRVGLTYISQIIYSNFLIKSSLIQNVDTILKPHTGIYIFVDSSYGDGTTTTYYFDQYRIDASMIFNINANAPWSTYFGAGFAAGVSGYAHSEIYYHRYNVTYTRYQDNSYGPTLTSSDSTSTQMNTNKHNFGVSVFIPIGFDFRLGNRNKFFQRIHLFAEIKPGYNFLIIQNVKAISNSFLQKGLGIRFSL